MSSIASRPGGRAAVRIAAPPGVFRPRSDALLLAAAMRERGLARGARVLDLFTGSGVLAVVAGLEGASAVTAVDLSRRAVVAARLNGRRNGVRLRALRGDLFAPVAGERFDLIVANPPYLPGADELPRGGAARAWEGGADGRLLVDRLCDGVRGHLAPGGRLLLVQSSLTGEAETLDRLASAGLRPRVLARRRGPLGPLARARSAALRAAGRLAPDADAEELLVIEAAAPGEAGARTAPTGGAVERDSGDWWSARRVVGGATAPPLGASASGGETSGAVARSPADGDAAEPPLPPRPAAPARITPYRDGPYLLRGPFELTDQDGRTIDCGRQTVALCRCGRSQIRPFCDGTHKLVGFRAAGGAEGGPHGDERRAGGEG
ncbi:HemK2/MTQ2 family protein methyltransferase [Conexibacter arvalis]|uniref:HemK-related putative methylase n=1 Tax=Conexibacter arvalis TaxID=912552 RepID=A0A840IEB8_9ACTN|nr:HemK2/MTQ2 family protein methyltransferase [Conexibacter arvalis]MBB4662280.1 HemK-related putative methylase [Conexibacter arvalis]